MNKTYTNIKDDDYHVIRNKEFKSRCSAAIDMSLPNIDPKIKELIISRISFIRIDLEERYVDDLTKFIEQTLKGGD